VRMEFTKVSNRWYVHHYYWKEGYSYRGLSLGHPYGNNLIHLFLSHRYYLSETSSVAYRIGAYKQPVREAERSVERIYLILAGERRFKSIILSGFLRIDRTHNYDADPAPHSYRVVRGERSFLTAGLSLSWRL